MVVKFFKIILYTFESNYLDLLPNNSAVEDDNDDNFHEKEEEIDEGIELRHFKIFFSYLQDFLF